MGATATTVEKKSTGFKVSDLSSMRLSEHEEVALDLGAEITVVDGETYKRAVETVGVCKKVIKRIKDHYKAILAPMDAVYDLAGEMKKDDLAPWEALSDRLDADAIDWLRRQRERERLQKIEDQKRADADAEARREQQATAMAAVAQMEPDPGVRAALVEEAEAIRTTPAIAAKVEIQTAIPKVPGAHTRDKLIGEVTSLIDLVKAVASGDVPITVLAVSPKGLNAYVNQSGASKTIPGVRILEDTSLVNR